MKKIFKISFLLSCILMLNILTSCSKKYIVTFVDYNGIILKEEIIQTGQNATPPTNPTREGYEFIGWDKEYTNISSNLTIIAQYSLINQGTTTETYTVTFVTNSNTVIEYQTVEKGEKATEPINPIKEGYTFDGWYLDNEKWSFIGYSVTDNIELVAKWNIITYNITYELDNGIITNPTTYTVEDEITLNNPTKEGYTFIGWASEEILEPQLNVTLNKDTGNKHFIANYTPNIYKISLNSNGGNEIYEDISILYNKEYDVTTYIPTRKGYTFVGWYNDETQVTNGIWNKESNLELQAKWRKNIEVFKENGYKYINLGKYPQTVVTDKTTINALSNISTTNSLGYIEYNGNEYKKVIAKPDWDDYTFINGNIIIEGNTYYFLVEPIKWRVLEENNGTYKLLCEMIIDNTNFYHTYDEIRTINGKIIYSNNYEYSNIRAWLNGYDGSTYNVDNYTGIGFLDIAFTEEEKELIMNTLIDNSLASTEDSSNDHVCNNTTDKIYLLSVKDTLNTNYGFSSDSVEYDTARRAQVSDYARSKTCSMYPLTAYYGNGYWLLRSHDYYQYYYVNGVSCGGDMFLISYKVDDASHGVRPALTITI